MHIVIIPLFSSVPHGVIGSHLLHALLLLRVRNVSLWSFTKLQMYSGSFARGGTCLSVVSGGKIVALSLSPTLPLQQSIFIHNGGDVHVI